MFLSYLLRQDRDRSVDGVDDVCLKFSREPKAGQLFTSPMSNESTRNELQSAIKMNHVKAKEYENQLTEGIIVLIF